jgi:hypothetical protein
MITEASGIPLALGIAAAAINDFDLRADPILSRRDPFAIVKCDRC